MKRLYAFIEDAHLDVRLLISLSLLMRDVELLEKKTWNSFSKSFFRKYSKQIQAYLGYEQDDLEVEKIEIEKKYSTLFLNCMGCMKRDGIIPDCSFEKMAEYIEKMFETGYTYNTLLNKLKEQNPECWQIEDAINSEKRRIKSNYIDENN